MLRVEVLSTKSDKPNAAKSTATSASCLELMWIANTYENHEYFLLHRLKIHPQNLTTKNNNNTKISSKMTSNITWKNLEDKKIMKNFF